MVGTLASGKKIYMPLTFQPRDNIDEEMETVYPPTSSLPFCVP
jgi:hypothetical protein